jgi:hypothetical protein
VSGETFSRVKETLETAGAALDEVARVADAVLFEGYLLYPYRASAQKNRIRWQFGVLTPAGFGEASNEPSENRTETLLEPRASGETQTMIHVRLRFLQLQVRTLHDAAGERVDELVVDGVRQFPFEEAVPREVDTHLDLDDLLAGEQRIPFGVPGEERTEVIGDGASDSPGGTVSYQSWPLRGELVASAEAIPGPYDVVRLRLDVRNTAECPADEPREVALRTALIAVHTMLVVSAAEFISLTDPPQWASGFAKECVNEHTWPLLAGPAGRADLLLSSPIILPDHPQLAAESPHDLMDGTEIDEILSLRTMVLTDEEKAEARATDPRAAAVIDHVDNMPPEIWERLHGAVRSLRPIGPGQSHDPYAEVTPEDLRQLAAEIPPWEMPDVPWWDPGADASVNPETDSIVISGHRVAKGSTVILRPLKGGDAQDQFLAGMRATVQAVLNDVDGDVHLAVSIDDDPAADMQVAHGRYRYFRPDEVEVVT